MYIYIYIYIYIDIYIIHVFVRCGGIFCGVHRNAEAHSCRFDYKTEGRLLLEQNNPVVAAEKLSKI